MSCPKEKNLKETERLFTEQSEECEGCDSFTYKCGIASCSVLSNKKED